MNFHAVLRKLPLKFAHCTCRDRVRDCRKKWRLRNEPRDLAKILGVIRRDPDRAVWEKRAMKRGEEGFIHKTAQRMAALGPGIGKHKVKPGDRILRKEPLDGVGNLEAQDARIRQAVPLDSPTGRAHAAEE